MFVSLPAAGLLEFGVGSIQWRLIGASGARPTAAALQERVGGVERLVCLLPQLWGRSLGANSHLHHQVIQICHLVLREFSVGVFSKYKLLLSLTLAILR